MDYEKLYNSLMSLAISKDIEHDYEIHHIIPKSLGGTDDKDNLVKLSLRQHFIAHKILVKITSGDSQNKMIYALWRMTNSNGYKISSRQYEESRKLFKESISKSLLGNQRTLGFKHSSQEVERRRQNMLGNQFSLGLKRNAETCKAISESKIGKSRKPFSEEWKSNLSKSKIGSKASKETKEKLSKCKSGRLNKNTKTYLVTKPNGISFSWINGLTDLCKEYELSLSRVSKYLDKTVPLTKNVGRPCTKEGRNSDGWTVQRYKN